MTWSWSQHPVYDNAFSLESTSQFTISKQYGVYFSAEVFNFINERYKYIEFDVKTTTNADIMFQCYPLVPKGVVINNFQTVLNYSDPTKGGVGILTVYYISTNVSVNDPSIEVTHKDTGSYIRLRPNYVSSTPARLGIAINDDSFILCFIYSSSNVVTQSFNNHKWTSTRQKRKLGYAWPDTESNGQSNSIYLAKSTWVNDYAKNNYDELKVVYPDEDMLKQY